MSEKLKQRKPKLNIIVVHRPHTTFMTKKKIDKREAHLQIVAGLPAIGKRAATMALIKEKIKAGENVLLIEDVGYSAYAKEWPGLPTGCNTNKNSIVEMDKSIMIFDNETPEGETLYARKQRKK